MSLLPGLTPWIVAFASFAGAGVIAFHAPAQPDPHPAAPEVRFSVPEAQAEPLLQLLAAHLSDAKVRDALQPGLAAAVLDDRVEATFYDDRGLSLLQLGTEVRHERHLARGAFADVLVLETPTVRHDWGDVVDGAASTRVEHALRLPDLLAAARRPEVEARCREVGIAPETLVRSLRVDRKRHGIELADEKGPLLAVAVVRCTSMQDDLALRFHECEIAADRTRWADPSQRPALARLRAAVVGALVGQFPVLQAEVAAPYASLFLRLQSGTWLPLRVLHGWNLTDLQAKVYLLLALAFAVGAPALTLVLRRVRAEARGTAVRTA